MRENRHGTSVTIDMPRGSASVLPLFYVTSLRNGQ